ncbi:pinin-like [Chenopodium quinoa]|uniref:pinin-like n=1 Tax=Chenopodium quinoa TaxID=63459 RepID=UPI000B7808FF|nr:pinin-like [Chenopodium quinoa]
MENQSGEKTEDELRKELEALQRQQREITERIRDPRGLRRGGFSGNAQRNNLPNQRPFTRPGERFNSKDEPPPKRRLSSAVVKVEDGEVVEEEIAVRYMQSEDPVPGVSGPMAKNDQRSSVSQQNRPFSGKIGNQQVDNGLDHQVKEVPRVLPKDEDPRLVNRNRRMLGQLLGTLEKFKKEDMKLSGTEAYMRRSDSLQRAEQKAREESERLRQQEREKIAENRKRDLVLRARVAAKTEEKKMELLFLQWSEHHKKLTNYLRTKAEPPIYYMPAKPIDENSALNDEKKEQAFLEWKVARREELSAYQKEVHDQYIANVERDLERWLTARKSRNANNDANLQETMDKELETHRLEHGPKARKIPDANNEDEEEVEDINVGEDDMMDDILDLDETERVDEQNKRDEDDGNPSLSVVE